jgi:hypothetical protein
VQEKCNVGHLPEDWMTMKKVNPMTTADQSTVPRGLRLLLAGLAAVPMVACTAHGADDHAQGVDALGASVTRDQVKPQTLSPTRSGVIADLGTTSGKDGEVWHVEQIDLSRPDGGRPRIPRLPS